MPQSFLFCASLPHEETLLSSARRRPLWYLPAVQGLHSPRGIPMALLWSLLLLFIAPISSATTCSRDEDCNLNGVCGGVCVCDPGWRGPTCGLLNLLPLQVGASGMNEIPTSSSWGGSVVYAEEDGLFHMFFSEILEHCPMSDWGTNSACFHSTSASAIGPFSNKSQVIGAWCHNAIIRESRDDIGKLYMLWHIGDGKEGSRVQKCGGGGDGGVLPPQPPALGSGYSNYFSYSRSVWGPWAAFGENVLPGGTSGSWDENVVNMAPFPLPNGTVLLGYRGSDAKHVEKLGVAIGGNWFGPYHRLSINGPIINASGEDPYLWVDKRGNFHMLFHAFATMGGHTFAREYSGPWTLSDVPPYNVSIQWNNGTHIVYAERERPELLLDATTGAPLVLYTSVLLPYSNTTGWGYSFTAAQGISLD